MPTANKIIYMNNNEFSNLLNKVYFMVPKLKGYPHQFKLENNQSQIVIRIKIRDKYYESIVDIEQKSEAQLLDEIINKVK